MKQQDTVTTGKIKKFKNKRFRVTHMDRGVQPATAEDTTGMPFVDPNSGRWPKVSFSNGETFSYAFITNTKVVYLTRDNQTVFTDELLNTALFEFVNSDRPYNESNWSTQAKRVSTWKPEQAQGREKAVA